MKNYQKGLAPIIIILIIAAALALAGGGWFLYQKSSPRANPKQAENITNQSEAPSQSQQVSSQQQIANESTASTSVKRLTFTYPQKPFELIFPNGLSWEGGFVRCYACEEQKIEHPSNADLSMVRVDKKLKFRLMINANGEVAPPFPHLPACEEKVTISFLGNSVASTLYSSLVVQNSNSLISNNCIDRKDSHTIYATTCLSGDLKTYVPKLGGFSEAEYLCNKGDDLYTAYSICSNLEGDQGAQVCEDTFKGIMSSFKFLN